MTPRIQTYLMLWFCALPAIGQVKQPSDLQVLEGNQTQVLWNTLIAQSHHLDQERAKQLSKALKSPERLQQHLVDLNKKYRKIIGPFPSRTPLNAQVTGRINGTSYRVEKVLFESLPNHHVTALLYLPPKGNGPWPGILFACGHSANGKAYPAYQTACALLAQNGFVVLNFDPISQGERTQQPKAQRYGTTTHTLLNHGSRLVGRSIVWYSAWDGIRSIDYLLSRSEVDKSKPIGMTGTSGGGTQTTFLMALDDRIGPAAPSCCSKIILSTFAHLVFVRFFMWTLVLPVELERPINWRTLAKAFWLSSFQKLFLFFFNFFASCKFIAATSFSL